jgi:hypothetical protein
MTQEEKRRKQQSAQDRANNRLKRIESAKVIYQLKALGLTLKLWK